MTMIRRVGGRAVRRNPGGPIPLIAAEAASFPITHGGGAGAGASPIVMRSPSPNERIFFALCSGAPPPSGVGSE